MSFAFDLMHDEQRALNRKHDEVTNQFHHAKTKLHSVSLFPVKIDMLDQLTIGAQAFGRVIMGMATGVFVSNRIFEAWMRWRLFARETETRKSHLQLASLEEKQNETHAIIRQQEESIKQQETIIAHLEAELKGSSEKLSVLTRAKAQECAELKTRLASELSRERKTASLEIHRLQTEQTTKIKELQLQVS